MTDSAILSMEQSRRTAAAVCACITARDYATGLIALAILAELVKGKAGGTGESIHPLLQSARVTARGLYSHAAVREEFPASDRESEDLAPHLESLRALPFEATASPGAKVQSATPSARPRHGDILFDIVRVREWSKPGDWASAGVSWLVRGGQWAYWNMNETGRVLLCRIAAASLSHVDPMSVVLTLKLGRTLGFGAVYPDNGGRLDLTVADALDAVGELPDPSIRSRSSIDALYSRFGEALQSLCDHGVMNDIVWPTGVGRPARLSEDLLSARFRYRPAQVSVSTLDLEKTASVEVLRF